MTLLRTAIAITAMLAASVLPAAAHAEKETVVVPPDNSAATQYTETFPTSGGNAEVNGGINGGHRGGGSGKDGSSGAGVSPETSEALQAEGADGNAVERLVTESAAPGSGGEAGGHDNHKQAGGAGGRDNSGGGSGRSGGGSGSSGPRGQAAGQSSGSSGVGEVVSHGTLSSSGGMEGFLPLILLVALVWAAFFAWRRRDREHSPPGPAS